MNFGGRTAHRWWIRILAFWNTRSIVSEAMVWPVRYTKPTSLNPFTMSSAIRRFSDKDVACLYVVKSIRGILKVESERTSYRLLGSALFPVRRWNANLCKCTGTSTTVSGCNVERRTDCTENRREYSETWTWDLKHNWLRTRKSDTQLSRKENELMTCHTLSWGHVWSCIMLCRLVSVVT